MVALSGTFYDFSVDSIICFTQKIDNIRKYFNLAFLTFSFIIKRITRN